MATKLSEITPTTDLSTIKNVVCISNTDKDRLIPFSSLVRPNPAVFVLNGDSLESISFQDYRNWTGLEVVTSEIANWAAYGTRITLQQVGIYQVHVRTVIECFDDYGLQAGWPNDGVTPTSTRIGLFGAITVGDLPSFSNQFHAINNNPTSYFLNLDNTFIIAADSIGDYFTPEVSWFYGTSGYKFKPGMVITVTKLKDTI
jgi:hypothetical protein